MAELYFLRHGQRVDHANEESGAYSEPIYPDYEIYDPSLSKKALGQIEHVGQEIEETTQAFGKEGEEVVRKNVFVHFSPYLRCCQTADLLISDLRKRFEEKFSNYKVRFQLLGDFALSEWIHDKMKNKPPFVDSSDAYHMYTPNVKLMANRSCVSNFRPTNTMGSYNGLDLSYKDYQSNCKSYFQKLLATYDKPIHIRNQDIVIVISHGYAINNFLSYFINHPIFDEIPEASVNYARRIPDTEKEVPPDSCEPGDFTWKLIKDSLGILENDDVDSTLNLETDIVYYKTNFFKKNELDESNNLKPPPIPLQDKPRASFRMSTTNQTKTNPDNKAGIYNYNPICPAAKDWSPQSKQFEVKANFKLKIMNDDSFKKSFSITNHPIKPLSPEVSPNSEPTRNNSVIDLTKLVDNHNINRPMKLKYSTTSEISIHKLNSKVNSQVNLAQYQRDNVSSNDSSVVDLPKYISSIQSKTRKRSTSNPILINVAHNAKDSYFPLNIIGKANNRQSNDLLASIESGSPIEEDTSGSDLDIIQEHNADPIQGPQQPENPLLSRSKSLNYKRNINEHGSTSLLARYKQHQLHNESDDSDSQKPFALPYNYNRTNNPIGRTPSQRKKVMISSPSSPVANASKSRRNSIKSISSVLDGASQNDAERANGVSTPTGFNVPSVMPKKPLFYPFNNGQSASNSDSGDSDDSSSSFSDIDDYNGDGDEDIDKMDVDGRGDKSNPKPKLKPKKKKNQYIWFGQNRK